MLIPRNLNIKTVSEKVEVVKKKRGTQEEVRKIVSRKTVAFSRNHTKFERIFLKAFEKLKVTGHYDKIKRQIKRFIRFSFFDKERKLLSVSTAHTSPARIAIVHIKHFFSNLFLLGFGVLRGITPVLLPAAAIGMIFAVFWGSSHYAIALRVKLNAETIAYVQNEEQFRSINARVAAEVAERTGEEYAITAVPVLELAVISKDDFTDQEEVYNTLSGIVEEYIGRSYGVFLDGQMLCSLRSESDFERLKNELVSYYVDDVSADNWAISNTFEAVRDTYAREYIYNYNDLLAMFTMPQTPKEYTVKKYDTAKSIAETEGITEPVLQMLNPKTDLAALSEGQVLQVGAPSRQITVENITKITYNEAIPYQTEYIETDEMYAGNTYVRTSGSEGNYTYVAEIREVNGKEVSREIISKVQTRAPVNRVVMVGTKTIAPSGHFMWPVSSSGYQYISSGFGWRTLRGSSNFHRGVDLSAAGGTPIYAADAGTVVFAGWDSGGLGYCVKVNHGNGITSVYGHARAIASGIYVGKEVYQGQTLAYVGSTGNSTGNHLHFALCWSGSGTFFDPMPYLR